MIEVNDLIYVSFSDKIEYQKEIIKIITKGDAYSIVYHGKPFEVEYKVIKRLLYSDVMKKIEIKKVKDEYKTLINKSDKKDYCIFLRNE